VSTRYIDIVYTVGAKALPFHVRDAETDTLVRRLAAETGVGITDSIKLAVANELERRATGQSLAERIKPLQDYIAARRITPEQSDKEFFDELSGNY
jgi:antitoxin VapB